MEIDGQLHLKRVFRDLERDNDHAFRDEATVRYGSVDLRGRPCRVAWQVGGALHRRGHPLPVPCPRCPDTAVTQRWTGLTTSGTIHPHGVVENPPTRCW